MLPQGGIHHIAFAKERNQQRLGPEMTQRELQPCRVGVLKVWYDNLRYFCNRTAQVTYVVHKSPPRKGPKKRKVKEGWEDSVNGRADIVFIDWPMFMNREYKVGEKKVGLVGMATKGN